jgi:hypothetical protein
MVIEFNAAAAVVVVRKRKENLTQIFDFEMENFLLKPQKCCLLMRIKERRRCRERKKRHRACKSFLKSYIEGKNFENFLCFSFAKIFSCRQEGLNWIKLEKTSGENCEN